MVDKADLVRMVAQARGQGKARNFRQSFDLFVKLKDIDVKKQGININEVVQLPHPLAKPAKVCVLAGGDLALRSNRAGADLVIDGNELDRYAERRREARKLARNYDFFLADASLMPKTGRILGPFLGPRGKMPTPLPPNAPVEGIIARLKGSIRARTRNQLSVGCKIGDEGLSDEQIAENALAVLRALEGRLPNGMRNIAGITIKKSMAPPVAMVVKG